MSRDIQIFIYRPGIHVPEERTIPRPRGYKEIKAALLPLIGCEDIEQVSVMFRNKAADMFVDETGAYNAACKQNIAATEIYHQWAKSQGKDMSDAAMIYGIAVVSPVRIWT